MSEEKLGIVVGLDFNDRKTNQANLNREIKALQREIKHNKDMQMKVGFNFSDSKKNLEQLDKVITKTDQSLRKAFKHLDIGNLTKILEVVKAFKEFNTGITLNIYDSKCVAEAHNNINKTKKDIEKLKVASDELKSGFSGVENGKLFEVGDKAVRRVEKIKQDLLTTLQITNDLNGKENTVTSINREAPRKKLYDELLKTEKSLVKEKEELKRLDENDVGVSNQQKKIELINEQKKAINGLIQEYKLSDSQMRKNLETQKKIFAEGEKQRTKQVLSSKNAKQQEGYLRQAKELLNSRHSIAKNMLTNVDNSNMFKHYSSQMRSVTGEFDQILNKLSLKNSSVIHKMAKEYELELQQFSSKTANKEQKGMVNKVKALLKEEAEMVMAMNKSKGFANPNMVHNLEQVRNKIGEIHRELNKDNREVVNLERIASEYNKLIALKKEFVSLSTRYKTTDRDNVGVRQELKNRMYGVGDSIKKQRAYMSQNNLTSAREEIKMNSELASSYEKLHMTQRKLDDGFSANKRKIESLRPSIQELINEFARLGRAEEGLKLKGKLNNLVNVRDLKTQVNGIKEVEQEMKAMQRSLVPKHDTHRGFSVMDGVRNHIGSQISMMMFDQVYRGIDSIKEIDEAFTEMKKVSNDSMQTLTDYKSVANEVAISVGHSTADTMKATAEAIKVGYGDLNTAKEIAKQTMVYSNVGDVDQEQASKSLISVLKGYNIDEPTKKIKAYGKEMTNLQRVMDLLNYTGNNFAITSGGVGDALQRCGSSMKVAGNSLEESVALITAGNTAVQDPTKVGTALKTISMRIRGMSVNKKTGQLEPTLMKKLEEAVGINITKLDENGKPTFKSTYAVMDELSKKWKGLDGQTQAYLTELIAGKNHGNTFSSMLLNMADAEKLVGEAQKENSEIADSSVKEQEKYMDSIKGRINALKETVVGFWTTAINSDSAKNFISVLTGVAKALTSLTKNVGVVPMLIGIVSAINSFKNNGTKGFIKTKGLHGMSEELINVEGAIEKVAKKSKGAEKGIGGLGKSMLLAKAKSMGMNLAMGALNGVIGMGVGLAVEVGIQAIGKAIQAIDNYINRVDIAVKKADEGFQKAKQKVEKGNNELANVNDLYKKDEDGISKGDRLDELAKKKYSGKELNTKELKEYRDLVAEVAKLAPELVQYYDSKGDPYINLSNGLKGVIEKLKVANKENLKLLAIEGKKVEEAQVQKMYSSTHDFDKGKEKTEFNNSFMSKKVMTNIESAMKDPKTFMEGLKDSREKVQKGYEEMEQAISDKRNSIQKIVHEGIMPKVQMEANENEFVDKNKQTIGKYFESLNLTHVKNKEEIDQIYQKTMSAVTDKAKAPQVMEQMKNLEMLNAKFGEGAIGSQAYQEGLDKVAEEMSKLTNLPVDKVKSLLNLKDISIDPRYGVELQGFFNQFGVSVLDTTDKANHLRESFTLVKSGITDIFNGDFNTETLDKILKFSPNMPQEVRSQLEAIMKDGVSEAEMPNVLVQLQRYLDPTGFDKAMAEMGTQGGKAFKEYCELYAQAEAKVKEDEKAGVKGSGDGTKYKTHAEKVAHAMAEIKANQKKAQDEGTQAGNNVVNFAQAFASNNPITLGVKVVKTIIEKVQKIWEGEKDEKKAHSIGEFQDGENNLLFGSMSSNPNSNLPSLYSENVGGFGEGVGTFGAVSENPQNLGENSENASNYDHTHYLTSTRIPSAIIPSRENTRVKSVKERVHREQQRKAQKKEIEDLKLELDLQIRLKNIIKDTNSELAWQNALKEHETEDKNKIPMLEKEIELMRRNQKEVLAYRDGMEKERVNVMNELKGHGFAFDDDNSMTNQVVKLQQLQDWANGFKEDEKKHAISKVQDIKKLADHYNDLWHNQMGEQTREWQNLDNKIQSTMKNIEDIKKKEIEEEKRKNEERLTSAKATQEKITSMLRKQVEERKKYIQEEADVQIKALEKVKEAMNKENSKEDFDLDMQDKYDELQEIQEKINDSELDSSATGLNRLNELHKEYAEKKKDIDKMLKDHNRQERQDEIDEQIKALQDKKELETKELDEKWDNKHLNEVSQWGLQTGVYKNVNGELRTLKDDWINFENEFGDGLGIMGDKIKEDFIKNMEDAKKTLEEIDTVYKNLNLTTYGTDYTDWSYIAKNLGNLNNFSNVEMQNTVRSYKENPNPMGINFNSPLLNVEGNVTKDNMPNLEELSKRVSKDVANNIYKAMYKKALV